MIFFEHLNDITKLIQLLVLSKLPLDSENGLNDTLEAALVNETMHIKLIEWIDGMTNFKNILQNTQKASGIQKIQTIF